MNDFNKAVLFVAVLITGIVGVTIITISDSYYSYKTAELSHPYVEECK